MAGAASALLLAITAGLESNAGIRLNCDVSSHGMRAVLTVDDVIWTESVNVTVLRLSDRSHQQSDGTLLLAKSSRETGADTLGNYTAVAAEWQLVEDGPAVVRTECRSYISEPTTGFVFTALSPLSLPGSRGRLPVVGFPSVNLTAGRMNRLGYAMWHGLWPQPVVGVGLTSLSGLGLPARWDGPVLLTDGESRRSVVLGPLDDPVNTVYGTTGDVLAFGPSPNLKLLPNGYQYTVVAVLGTGPTDAVAKYGNSVRAVAAAGRGVHNTSQRSATTKLRDPSLQFLSAWTDNGAFFYYNEYGARILPPPAKAIPAWIRQLRSAGVPAKVLQLDGWWPGQLDPDPNPEFFPNWDDFRTSLGNDTKLVLYKAFFAKGFSLFSSLNVTAVQSPKGAFYPDGPGAERFYTGLFEAFKRMGMSGYEIDFLSDHLLPTEGLAGSVEGLQLFLKGLGRAGETLGVPMQWCMPTAGLILATAGLPAVTNARASVDYAQEAVPGSHWNPTYMIGVPSLLFWAAGLAPSKDITWTRPRQAGGANPPPTNQSHGSDFNPNVELDFVLAVLSTGPVGLGDGPNRTNITLARMAVRADGTILKPDKPLTAIDSTFVPLAPDATMSGVPATNSHKVGLLPLASGSSKAGCRVPCAAFAEQTHTSIPIASDPSGGKLIWRAVVAVHLGPFVMQQPEWYPPTHQSSAVATVIREWRWKRCQNGTTVSAATKPSCIRWMGPRGGWDISSGSALVDTLGAQAWAYWQFSPALQGQGNSTGWVFLGEVDKVTAVSSERFLAVGMASPRVGLTCMLWWMRSNAVVPTEMVTVAAISPAGVYLETHIMESHDCVRRSGTGGTPCEMCAPA